MIAEKMISDDSNDILTEEDVQLTLDNLLSHKMVFTQQYLRECGLVFSGTKAVLRERLVDYLNDGRLEKEQLVELLNRIEGWGNQHIYLYQSPDYAIEPWRDEESTKRRFINLNLIDLVNRQRPLILPEETTLSSIEWSTERLRFLWVEKRQWEEPIPEEDIEQGNIVWRAYRKRTSRSITVFEWDLISGNAMLMIQRLPTGTRYKHLKDNFEKELEPIIGIQWFEPVRISRAILSIESSEEVRRRHLAYETRRGGMASFTSANVATDTFDDPALERSDLALGDDKAGWLGNFFWLPIKGKIESDLHLKLYAFDQRVGIFGERREYEVRHVISRIRELSS